MTEGIQVRCGCSVIRGCDDVENRRRPDFSIRAHKEFLLERRRIVDHHLFVQCVRQRHGYAFAHQARRLQSLLRSDEVDRTQLVVFPPPSMRLPILLPTRRQYECALS